MKEFYIFEELKDVRCQSELGRMVLTVREVAGLNNPRVCSP